MICYCSKFFYWEDRIELLEWLKRHMCQISADNHTKEDGYKYELLILQYNLDGKVQKQYQEMFQDGANTIC